MWRATKLFMHKGVTKSKWMLLVKFCTTESVEEQVAIEFFVGDEFGGEPLDVQRRSNTDLML
jgi:hypothetical protein